MSNIFYNFFVENFKRRNIITYILLIFSPFYWFFCKIVFFFQKKKQIILNPAKIICVGNIVAGGAGKTQFIITLIDIIQKNDPNLSICIVSKGYGRKSNRDFFIPKKSLNFNPKDTGDEPLLLSEYCDVFVVKNRNKLDDRIKNYDFVILDDGFQDHKIFKNINIIIFDADFFIGNGFLLPAGPLRNNIKIIKNADLIILNNFDENNEDHLKNLNILKKYKTSKDIFISKINISSSHQKDKDYIAFSGLGDNGKFFNLLKKNNFKIKEFISFPDHHFYSKKEINNIYQKIFQIKGKGITTKKDLIKIKNIQYKFDNKIHSKIISLLDKQDFLECLEITNKLENEQAFFQTLISKNKIY